MNRKKRIAIIGCKGIPAFHGIDRAVESYVSHLTSDFDFSIYCSAEYTDMTSGPYRNYQLYVLKKIANKRLNTLWYYIKSVFLVTCVHSYELVHIHHSDAAFLLPLLRIRYGKRVVVTTHGAFTPLNDKWKRFALYFWIQSHVFLRFAGKLTSVAQNEVRNIGAVLQRTSTYIPNGISTQIPACSTDVGQGYLLFAAGRIMKLKGLDLLLEAISNGKIDVPLRVLGDISHAPEEHRALLTKLAEDLPIEWRGMIKDPALLYQNIRCCRLFIFPSRAETMSIQLLEAVSLKVPVICSDIIANRDIFSPEEMLFFQSEQADDLAEKIQYALTHPEEMQIRAEKAYRKLMKEYTWEAVAQSYKEVYLEMLGER